jgi:hypothetical protein
MTTCSTIHICCRCRKLVTLLLCPAAGLAVCTEWQPDAQDAYAAAVCLNCRLQARQRPTCRGFANADSSSSSSLAEPNIVAHHLRFAFSGSGAGWRAAGRSGRRKQRRRPAPPPGAGRLPGGQGAQPGRPNAHLRGLWVRIWESIANILLL